MRRPFFKMLQVGSTSGAEAHRLEQFLACTGAWVGDSSEKIPDMAWKGYFGNANCLSTPDPGRSTLARPKLCMRVSDFQTRFLPLEQPVRLFRHHLHRLSPSSTTVQSSVWTLDLVAGRG